jgi:hypothetical protein
MNELTSFLSENRARVQPIEADRQATIDGGAASATGSGDICTFPGLPPIHHGKIHHGPIIETPRVHPL